MMPRGAARAVALSLVLVVAARADAAPVRDPSCAVTQVVLTAGTSVFRLQPFVRAGSDSVWSRRGAWVRGRDYAIDLLRGDVRLLRAPAAGETLWVAACRLLAPPPLEVAHLRYRPPGSLAGDAPDADSLIVPPATARAATARDPSGAPPGATLALTGNKTLAVEFGSTQDATLRQSLDLSVTGTLAPGVELTGVLSDQSTPLSAAGATQDLQSLDRLLVELRGPQGSASLGDLPLTLDRGEFARMERRLQGARGTWHAGGATVFGAAASAQGEYQRMQFSGVEGRQGPYLLTGRDGGTGITVVAGSEVVTLDGARLTRGETADYVMDYERARLTFSNRRPISSASRITVEYQYAVTRFRRNLAAGGAEWKLGGLSLFTNVLAEGDDRGRPLDATLGATERLVLASAGDSATRALAAGVTAAAGDYDSLRTATGQLVYAWAGPDSGAFQVRFAPVAQGAGDYVDSTVVSGRTAYRFVGAGLGRYVIGRALPLAESQRLWSAGGRWARGGLVMEAEGAVSRLDRNTFSALDDGDDAGAAGRLALAWSRPLAGRWGRLGVEAVTREVGRRFAPFSRLERPFAEEDWGLPAGADLEHQRRSSAAVRWQPGARGDELRADVARLVTPDGYAGWRRAAEWRGGGVLGTHAAWSRSDGAVGGLAFGGAGRERWQADVRAGGAWVTPTLRFESDRRTFAADTGRAGERFREWGGELASGSRVPWRVSTGLATRRDAVRSGEGWFDLRDVRTLRVGLESPAASAVSAVLQAQRRDLRPLGDPTRSRSDLASVRLRAEHRERGLTGTYNLELTSEGENRRARELRFVGAGRGGYDALGNFVGTGDFDLVLVVSNDLDRVARAAASARASWTFGSSDAWRGSRLEFVSETEARRRGGARAGDAWLSGGAVLADAALSRGSVLQRLESDLAPGSRAASVYARLERRVTGDRSYSNFAQVTDQRTGQLRWRARPAATVTLESEGRVQWQRATQALAGGARYERTLVEQGGQGVVAWQPAPSLRTSGALEATWSRPDAGSAGGVAPTTRTLRVGPDVGLSVGARGRLEFTARRAFVAGPPASGLLPAVDPAGAARWDATARADVRLRDAVTFGLTAAVRERPGRAAIATGRAELRAFF